MQATHTAYKLDDGTGTLEVKIWRDFDAQQAMEVDGQSKDSRLVENAYAKVLGRLESFNDRRHVAAHVIRPIMDYNEVAYHLLEATAVHLYFTRGPPPDKNAIGGGAYQQQNSMAGNNAAGADNGGGGGMGGLPNNVSQTAKKLYMALKNAPESNEGLGVQQLASQMGQSTGEVFRASEELLQLGVIFTTVDDNTWAILEY